MYFNNGVNQYVCGHHGHSQKAHPELRFDITNGKCVCAPCHHAIHAGTISS